MIPINLFLHLILESSVVLGFLPLFATWVLLGLTTNSNDPAFQLPLPFNCISIPLTIAKVCLSVYILICFQEHYPPANLKD
ncbi:hypothetical protein EDB19DRAFT_873514 [Suillus lakei]|nr:hypothetical protein EDB19DRAFT_873514 [Suillus lakei]